MNTKDISAFFHINQFDIYEVWKEAKHIGEDIVQSEYGRFARQVLDEAGEVIGRVFVEVLEDVIKDVADTAVSAATDKLEEIKDEVKESI